MRSIPFVTNRPPMTGGFGPPPPCGTPESLSFGTLAAMPSATPARPGQLAGPITLTGAVDCSNPGSDAALVAFLTRLLTAAVQADQTPIVMVHGYSYSFSDAIIRAADLCAWFEAGDFPLALAPIAFTWPSVNGLSPEDYLADRARAAASANAYSRFMLAFAAASAAAGRPRCLYLAHSMGTWVSQNGLRALAAGRGSTLPADLFDQALVMGGDADTDALEPGQGLDQLARLSTWLTVGVNRTDFATGVTANDILKRPRLGSSGPASTAKIPSNARILDYTLAITADQNADPARRDHLELQAASVLSDHPRHPRRYRRHALRRAARRRRQPPYRRADEEGPARSASSPAASISAPAPTRPPPTSTTRIAAVSGTVAKRLFLPPGRAMMTSCGKEPARLDTGRAFEKAGPKRALERARKRLFSFLPNRSPCFPPRALPD